MEHRKEDDMSCWPYRVLLRNECGISWFQFLVVVWLSPLGKLLNGVLQQTTNKQDEAEGVPDLVVFSKNPTTGEVKISWQ